MRWSFRISKSWAQGKEGQQALRWQQVWLGEREKQQVECWQPTRKWIERLEHTAARPPWQLVRKNSKDPGGIPQGFRQQVAERQAGRFEVLRWRLPGTRCEERRPRAWSLGFEGM